jgi:Flp pilus assembly protein TadD
MSRRPTAVAWALCIAACGGGTATMTPPKLRGGTQADSTAMSPPMPVPAPTPPAAIEVPSSVSPPTVTSSSASPVSRGASLPAPRPSTIALAAGDHGPGDVELAAGDDAFEKGDLDGARKHYEAARAAAPRNVAPSVGLARVRIARVDVALDYAAGKGNPEIAQAGRELARATKAVPSFGPGFVEYGRAMLLLGDASTAVGALRKGTALLPDEAEAHSQLGIALLATGHAAEAVSELTRAAELDPGSAARHGNLGTALMMAGRTKEAIAEYETRVRIDDGDARAHSDLGTALLGTQDLARALSELHRAVQGDPGRASLHSNLGYALQQAGRVDQAIVEYREALRLDPHLVSGWINLATALAIDPKTRTDARAALEKARALSPDDPRVKANIEELDALSPGASVPPKP